MAYMLSSYTNISWQKKQWSTFETIRKSRFMSASINSVVTLLLQLQYMASLASLKPARQRIVWFFVSRILLLITICHTAPIFFLVETTNKKKSQFLLFHSAIPHATTQIHDLIIFLTCKKQLIEEMSLNPQLMSNYLNENATQIVFV